MNLNHCAIKTGPVVHGVDGEQRINTAISRGDGFGRAVGHGDALPRTLCESTHTEDAAHEWRRIYGQHRCTATRGQHRRRSHASAKVHDMLAGLRRHQRDHRCADLRTPHPRQQTHVAREARQPAIVGMPEALRIYMGMRFFAGVIVAVMRWGFVQR